MEPAVDPIAQITAPIIWNYVPLANLPLLDALPPAARERETKKAADTFASTGRNVFVHYATPILEERRKRLLASGLRRKKYPKTAAQLWHMIGHDEEFYWNEVARSLRLGMKLGILSPKGCLVHEGRAGERESYVYHAEVAVAGYLELPPPTEMEDGEEAFITFDSETKLVDVTPKFERAGITAMVGDETSTPDLAAENDTELLDTLRSRFEYDQKMLYSHFAHYDYAAIRNAEGKRQTAMLRQLADLFDKTGKILFYYYAVPRLCKRTYPSTAGETVTGEAAKAWRLLFGAEKEKWRTASAGVKKRLGDGDVGGLEVLELGSLDAEVLGLHELARSQIAGVM